MILKCSYEKLDTIWLQILLMQLKPHPEMQGKPTAQVFDMAACNKLRYDSEPGAMSGSFYLNGSLPDTPSSTIQMIL